MSIIKLLLFSALFIIHLPNKLTELTIFLGSFSMPDISVESFDFIVNRRGGTVLKIGEENVRKEILAQFGDKAGTFTYVEGGDVAAAVKAWAEKNAGQNRGLVIGGGDGTVISAVEQVLGRDDITLGILPLGTQNFVARQVGFSADFKAAAAQYKSGQSVEMDVGKVNGMHFLVGITFDPNSVNFYEAREDMRDKKRLSAFKKTFAAATGLMVGKKKEFLVSTGNGQEPGKKISGRVIAITNNSLKPRAVKSLPYSDSEVKNILTRIMGKGEKRTGELSLYAIRGGWFRTARLMPDILLGKWDHNRSVRKESATHFVIEAGTAKEAPFILDGEIKTTQYPLDVSIISKGLRMFKPS